MKELFSLLVSFVINKTFYKIKKVFNYYQQNKMTHNVNESILGKRECSIRYADARVRCSECNCTNITHACYFHVFRVS